MNIIEVENLSFSYGGAPALENISFTVKQGDFTGVLGPNGGGKTTLIKIMLGLLKSESGRVKIFGKEISGFSEWQKIGYLEQKISPPSLMPLTAFEIARMGLLSSKKTPKIFNKADNEITENIMRTTGCLPYKNKLFYELSGGQQQRTLLARTLINKPSLLILDEPSTALDAASRESFFDLLRAMNKQNNTTILLITHDIADVGRHVNNFLILDKNLIFYGSKQNFCGDKKAAQYFGPYTPHLMDHLHTDGQNCPFGAHK
jgi:zinc transport system ATP-binding protein